MFSYVKVEHTEVNKGKHLVETWGKVLVTSGYTDYVITIYQNLVQKLFQKLLAKFLPSPIQLQVPE